MEIMKEEQQRKSKMNVQTEVKDMPKENVIDDISDQMDMDKLKELKAKMKGNGMAPRIVEKKTRSLEFGVIGAGHSGSRLAQSFYELGYQAVCFNTTTTDLENIRLPDKNKLLLNYGLGGASKERDIGYQAANTHRDALNELFELKLSNCQMYVLAFSLGGGSGSGAYPVVLDILAATGKPIIVITVLPMSFEDSHTKQNSLEALSELTKEIQNKRVSNLFVVDNSKLETIFKDVGQMDFFDVANKAIIEPLDIFNTFSSKPSNVKSLDQSEFGKILVDSNGLSIYGQISVANYQEDTGLAESIMTNLNNGLLVSGFNIKETKYAGVMFIAKKSTWDKTPSSAVNYAMAIINENCEVPNAVFKGIYQNEEMEDDIIKVYFIFSGLGLPTERVEGLKKEITELNLKTKNKSVERDLNLKLNTGVEETVSAAQKVRDAIQKKKIAFGSLMNNAINDLRKK